MELPAEVVRNKERIVALERDMGEVKDAITEMRDRLLGRLPNWASLLLTVLGMTVAGLIVAMVKGAN